METVILDKTSKSMAASVLELNLAEKEYSKSLTLLVNSIPSRMAMILFSSETSKAGSALVSVPLVGPTLFEA